MTGTQISIRQCQRRNILATVGTLYFRAKYRVLKAWIDHEVRINIVLFFLPAPVGLTLHSCSTTLDDLLTPAYKVRIVSCEQVSQLPDHGRARL